MVTWYDLCSRYSHFKVAVVAHYFLHFRRIYFVVLCVLLPSTLIQNTRLTYDIHDSITKKKSLSPYLLFIQFHLQSAATSRIFFIALFAYALKSQFSFYHFVTLTKQLRCIADFSSSSYSHSALYFIYYNIVFHIFHLPFLISVKVERKIGISFFSHLNITLFPTFYHVCWLLVHSLEDNNLNFMSEFRCKVLCPMSSYRNIKHFACHCRPHYITSHYITLVCIFIFIWMGQ